MTEFKAVFCDKAMRATPATVDIEKDGRVSITVGAKKQEHTGVPSGKIYRFTADLDPHSVSEPSPSMGELMFSRNVRTINYNNKSQMESFGIAVGDAKLPQRPISEAGIMLANFRRALDAIGQMQVNPGQELTADEEKIKDQVIGKVRPARMRLDAALQKIAREQESVR